VALAALLAGCSEDETQPPFSTLPQLPPVPWFMDIWGSGESDVTIVGRPGLIVHFDGAAWSALSSPTTVTLTAIWGASANEVYACGHDGVILRNTGGGWGVMGSGTMRDLYDVGVGPEGLVYVCGERGELLRLADNKQSWLNTPDLIRHKDDAGNPDDTLYRSEGDISGFTAIGHQAISGAPYRTRQGSYLMTSIVPEAGLGWQLIAVEGDVGYLNASWGDAGEIARNWLASDLGRLYRLQQALGVLSWKEKASPSVGDAVTCIWGAPGGQRYYFTTRSGKIIRGTVIGNNDNMTHQVVYPGGVWLSAIWGTSETNIYAVGYDATLLHYDGTSWSPITVPLTALKVDASPGPETDKYGRPLR
jgi:hypothetical protein